MTSAPRAAILCIGSELLRGDGLDTNSRWLSQRLERLGYVLRLHLACADREDEIVDALALAWERAEVIVLTGGLGPTSDDLTRAAVARFLGLPLELDPASLAHIEALFASFGREMSPSNRRQAELPRGARVLTNGIGTAPAFACARDGRRVYALPGVPREVYWLWETYLDAELAASGAPPLAERTFRTVGIGESQLGERLAPLEARAGLEVRYCVEEEQGTIRVTLLAASEDQAQDAWLEAKALLQHHVACEGSDRLAEAVLGWLCARRLTLATAESCTGGRVAATLVALPGASRVFGRGVVSYADQAKVDLLDVPAELLGRVGAVSEEVARAMALGARRRAGSDLGLGVTGIAGPGGGSAEKPVGLVHYAVAGPGEQVLHERRRFPGARDLVQARASAAALALVVRALR